MAAPDLAAIIADPRWLAHRYDARRDEIHFVWFPRDAHRDAGFLTGPEVSQEPRRHVVPRREAARFSCAQAPLHLILHSGLTGSTLLARALDREGASMTLSEPPILTDVVSCRIAHMPAAQLASVLDDVLRLLARPFGPNEAVIIKAGSVGNILGDDILARRPSSRTLCLYAPLDVYLASIARKGLLGRIWGRKLFGTLRSARLSELGFSEAEIFEHTDLQIAADAWLILHRVMGLVAAKHGSRVRALDSERLIARREDALGAVSGHFGLGLDPAALARDPLFTRHAKTGEAFDMNRRAEELEHAGRLHREEIDRVVDWARKVAAAQRISWDLPGG